MHHMWKTGWPRVGHWLDIGPDRTDQGEAIVA